MKLLATTKSQERQSCYKIESGHDGEYQYPIGGRLEDVARQRDAKYPCTVRRG